MGLFKQVANIFRSKKIELEEALKNPERDIRLAIIDSKKQAVDFQARISELSRQNKLLERQLEEKQAKVVKHQEMAAKAVETGNEADALTLLEAQGRYEGEVKSLQDQIAKNQADLESARKQLMAIQSKIKDAEINESRLKMRLESAKIRESLAKARSEMYSDDNPLVALNDLSKAVDQAEASAEAVEEEVGLESGNVEQSLEEKYASPAATSNAQEKLAALKASMGK